VRAAIDAGILSACHDVSDGGLLVAVAEMALASGLGAELRPAPAGLPAHGWWFGEDQARYVVATRDAAALGSLAARAGIELVELGRTAGEPRLTLPGEVPISLGSLRAAHEAWLPRFMAGAS